MYTKEEMGHRMYVGMKDKGMNIDEFARSIGTTRNTVSSWIHGRRGISFENAVLVCDVLGWPLERLACKDTWPG